MKLQNLYRDECGATLVEMSVVLPVFIVLTFSIAEAGLMLYTQVGLQHGSEMASRCASISDMAIKYGGLDVTKNPTKCYTNSGDAVANVSTVKTFAANNSWGVGPPASAFSVSVKPASCPGGNLVTVSYPFTAVTYLLSKTLTAQSCYPTP
jgi:Flp pilus assembly protein TadG